MDVTHEALHKTLGNMADILQVKFKYDAQSFKIEMLGKRTIHLAGLSFRLYLSCVSTRILDNRLFAIITVKGNLALLLDVPVKDSYPVTLHFLNLAKMDKPDNLLEMMDATRMRDGLNHLFPAIAASFYFDDIQGRWQPVMKRYEDLA